MNRYNNMMKNHFAGKTQIASMPDPGRGRTIKVFFLDDEVVGLSDGTDAWVASPGACCLALRLPDLIAKHKAGELHYQEGDPPTKASARRRVLVDDETTQRLSSCPTTRRRVHVD